MQILNALSLLSIGFFLLTACQSEETIWNDSVPPTSPEETGTVTLQFQFSFPSESRKAFATDPTPDEEESQVNNLVYAIFQNNSCKEVQFKNLTGIFTGEETNRERFYTLPNISKKWLDHTTEIYAVANVPESLKNELLNGSYPIPDDYPLILHMVTERIDSLAKAQTYDSLLNDVYNYEGGNIPKWNERYYFPPNKNNKINGVTYDNKYRCATYADFVKRLNNPSNTPEEKATYEMIWEDLQCRFLVIKARQDQYHAFKNKMTEQENQSHTLRKAFQADPNLQKYLLWRNMEYTENLNLTAQTSTSRSLDQPLMAGHYRLGNSIPATIVVPVERTYCRIWFNFLWNGQKEAKEIIIDQITVNGLRNNTRLFNLSKEGVNNNPTASDSGSCTLGYGEPTDSCKKQAAFQSALPAMQPFFPRLEATAYPYHNYGENQPQMLIPATITAPLPLWVYTYIFDGKEHQINRNKKPHRCYMYSFQWGGNTAHDDPEIIIDYHFTPFSSERGVSETRIRKRAKARLYDETHHPGKRHHGLLRNYTYQLNCQVNSLSNLLEVQIVAVPWYTHSIDDIPPFE